MNWDAKTMRAVMARTLKDKADRTIADSERHGPLISQALAMTFVDVAKIEMPTLTIRVEDVLVDTKPLVTTDEIEFIAYWAPQTPSARFIRNNNTTEDAVFEFREAKRPPERWNLPNLASSHRQLTREQMLSSPDQKPYAACELWGWDDEQSCWIYQEI